MLKKQRKDCSPCRLQKRKNNSVVKEVKVGKVGLCSQGNETLKLFIVADVTKICQTKFKEGTKEKQFWTCFHRGNVEAGIHGFVGLLQIIHNIEQDLIVPIRSQKIGTKKIFNFSFALFRKFKKRKTNGKFLSEIFTI